MTDGDKSHLDDQQRDELKLDYQQTNTYINMLTNTRLVPLTLLPGLTGAAVSLLTNMDNPRTALALGLIGFFASFALILNDIRSHSQQSAAVYRAKSIERSLKLPAFVKDKQEGGLFNENPNNIVLAQPKSSKKPLRVPHKNIISVIYGVVMGGWTHILVHASIRSLPSGWQLSEVATDLVSIVIAAPVAFLTAWGLSRLIEHNEFE